MTNVQVPHLKSMVMLFLLGRVEALWIVYAANFVIMDNMYLLCIIMGGNAMYYP